MPMSPAVRETTEFLEQVERALADGDVESAQRLLAEARAHHERTARRLERLESFGALFDHRKIFPAVANFEGYFEWVSPGFCRALGWTREEFTSRPWTEFVHPDDLESTIAAASQLSHGNAVIAFENRYRTKGGDYLRLRWFSSVDMEAGLSHGIAIDVTEEYVAEGRRARRDMMLEQAGALAQVGAWEIVHATDSLHWTPQLYAIHEMDESERVSGPRSRQSLAPEARDDFMAAMEAGLETSGGWDLEVPIITAQGNRKWIRTIGRRTVVDGEFVGLHGAVQDITDIKTREDELRRAKEEAQEASRFKSEFLANMSHEIRTPLNGILGTLQLVADLPLAPDARELTDVTQHSAENLLVIVNDLLDLAKIEAGQLSLERIAFEPGTVVEDVARVFHGPATSKGISLNVNGDVSSVSRLGDPTRVRQILTNFVSNAVKFTERGGVAITYRADGERVRFEVRDSGIGIEPDQVGGVFESFRQADGSITRRFGGTGLGLAICRQLVAAMGGEIGVDSEPGVGSTFWFELPLAECDKPEPLPVATEVSPSESTSLHVLLAEDNDINAMVAERTLAKLGHRVTRVVDGHLSKPIRRKDLADLLARVAAGETLRAA